jgi:hypothetical protein
MWIETGWWSDSSGRLPTLEGKGTEFKPQYHKKKKKGIWIEAKLWPSLGWGQLGVRESMPIGAALKGQCHPTQLRQVGEL